MPERPAGVQNNTNGGNAPLIDEQNEITTQRLVNDEEVKNGYIREERESENENGTER